MATADCLLNCLQEVKLERFHKNFVERGLLNCEQLSSLTLDDYARYGVVSTDDRRRLFQLVHIIKSVQADGVFCHHGGIVPPAPKKPVPKVQLSRNILQNGNRKHNEINVAIARTESSAELVREKCPPAPSKSFIKPINGDLNYRVHYENPSKGDMHHIHATKETKVNVVPANEKGDSTPVFRCRKTLKFSDSELYSDDENGSAAHNALSSSTGKDVKRVGTVLPVSNNSDYSSSGGKNGALLHITQPTVTSSVSSGAVTELRRDKKSEKSKTVSDNNSTVDMSRTVSNGNARAIHPVKRLSNGGVQEARHAYFPAPACQTEELPVHVEHVFHTTGYNYGIPTSGVLHAVNQRTADVDLNIEGQAMSCNEKIRVCVRKRPRTMREVKRSEQDVVKIRGRRTVIVEELKVAVDLTKYMQQHVMTFDVAFDETCHNKDVYERAVKPLVSAVFERSSAVCFAFGQTGAGKTYTLMGTKSEPGLYQLAGEDLFTLSRSSSKQLGSLHIWASYYEIYCGHLYDLLNKRKRLHVRENGRHKVCITGLMENEVSDLKSLIRVVSYGNSFRSHGSTSVNPHSSRSHALLQLEVRNSNDAKIGRMTFIDLAGSERAADAVNSDRQTRMEGAEINQSLLALKECIRSIDQEACHTPYRQSKLTHILRESFLGQSLTVMIANVAPTQSACEDTLNTLRYADRVKELTKEAAKKANGSGSTANVTQTISNTATADVVHPGANLVLNFDVHPGANLVLNSDVPRSPVVHPLPSLFHPSNIQCTSTPVKAGTAQKQNVFCDSNRILLDGVGELPISGHKILRGSSVEDVHLGRISPIDDSPKPINLDEHVPHYSSPVLVETKLSDPHNFPLTSIASHELAERNSPCSCRSTEDISAACRMSQLTTNASAVTIHRHVTSDNNEPRVLFAEVKTCMENARANIRNFLQGEKDRGIQQDGVVHRNEITDVKYQMTVETKSAWLSDKVTSEGEKSHSATNCGPSIDTNYRSLPTVLAVDGPSQRQVAIDHAAEPSANYDSNFFVHREIPRESGSTSNKEASARSWAEIFEKSAEDLPGENGVSDEQSVFDNVGPADNNNMGSVDDNDLVTPELLETLKVKIADLKRRQELLERDQFFYVRNPGAASPASVQAGDSLSTKSFHGKLIDIDSGMPSNDNHVLTLQSQATKSTPRSLSDEPSHSNLSQFSAHHDKAYVECVVNSAAETALTQLPLRNNLANTAVTSSGISSFGSAISNSGLVTTSTSDYDYGHKGVGQMKQQSHQVVEHGHIDTEPVATRSRLPAETDYPVASLLASNVRPDTHILSARSNIGQNDTDVISSQVNIGHQDMVIFSSNLESAFTVVDRRKGESGDTLDSKGMAAVTLTQSGEAFISAAKLTPPVAWQQATFMPIEPHPVTFAGSETVAVNGWRTLDSKAIEMSGSSADSLRIDHASSTSSGHKASISELNARQRSENLLILSHEDQLTAVIHLCKQEMSLLIDVRSGLTNFDDYLVNVQNILATKQKIIAALNQHIGEFR